jgi:peptide/nickel transport system permease protein
MGAATAGTPVPRRGSKFFRYLARRLLQAGVSVLAVIVLGFMLLHLAPGDPVDVLAGEFGAASPEYLAQLRSEYGLDRSLAIQLLDYIENVARLNLGYSFRDNTTVLDLILSRLPATLLLMTTSIALAFIAGLVLGVIAAQYVNRFADNLISVLALLCYAVPLFWFGLMAIVLFTVKLGWPPGDGMFTIGANYSWFGDALDVARHLILPAASLALFHMAVYTRLMRASMLEVYGLDYVRTARAKGLSQRRVAIRHVLPNAILPMVSMVGVQIGPMLGGAVLVETVFGWPGLGRLAFDATFQRDYNLLLGILLFSSVLVVATNFAIDLVYGWLDPRIEAY